MAKKPDGAGEKAGAATRFRPGQSGNPKGRVLGSRNKLQTSFIDVLYADFEAHGEEAMRRCRDETPGIYIKVVASLMPKEFEVKRPLQDLSDDELIAIAHRLREEIAGARERGSGTESSLGAGPPGGVPTLQ